MKKLNTREFDRLLEDEPIYFINSFEDAVIRSEITNRGLMFYVKFKGEEEFKAENGSGVVIGGVEECTIISKEEYEGY